MSVQHAKNKPIIIGLTGSIASGKSTASMYFKKHHIPVIDSDQIVKDLWIHNQSMLAAIEDVFHTLDKQNVARLIFSDEKARHTLNHIVHPYVFKEIDKQLRSLQDESIIVIDMPLLFEAGYQKYVDYTAVVYSDLNTAKQRLIERDGLNEQEAHARILAQMPIEEKIQLADFTLDNTRDVSLLYQAIDQMLRSIGYEE